MLDSTGLPAQCRDNRMDLRLRNSGKMQLIVYLGTYLVPLSGIKYALEFDNHLGISL